MKKCNECLEYKTLQEFYLKNGKPTQSKCIQCIKKFDKEKTIKKKEENGGSLMVGQNPNTYFDNYQKENTFEIMKLLEYLYDEQTGIWYKPGWKEIVDGQPVFLKIKNTYQGSRKRVINPDMIQQVLAYRKKGWNKSKIATKFNVSCNTITKICIIYGNETRKNR